MKLWLWRRHRRFPRVVQRPRVVRLYPNDPVDTRTFRRRLDEAEIVGRIRRAQIRGEIP